MLSHNRYLPLINSNNYVSSLDAILEFSHLAHRDERVKELSEVEFCHGKPHFRCLIRFTSGGEIGGRLSLERIAALLFKEPFEKYKQIQDEEDIQFEYARSFKNLLDTYRTSVKKIDDLLSRAWEKNGFDPKNDTNEFRLLYCEFDLNFNDYVFYRNFYLHYQDILG